MTGPPPPLPSGHAVNHARAKADGLIPTVTPEWMLTNAVMWGHLSDELLDAIDLTWIEDVWCRSVIASVIVLRSEGRDVTLATVHHMLTTETDVHGGDDVWWLAMAAVTNADGRLDEDAAAVYLEQLRIAAAGPPEVD